MVLNYIIFTTLYITILVIFDIFKHSCFTFCNHENVKNESKDYECLELIKVKIYIKKLKPKKFLPNDIVKRKEIFLKFALKIFRWYLATGQNFLQEKKSVKLGFYFVNFNLYTIFTELRVFFWSWCCLLVSFCFFSRKVTVTGAVI